MRCIEGTSLPVLLLAVDFIEKRRQKESGTKDMGSGSYIVIVAVVVTRSQGRYRGLHPKSRTPLSMLLVVSCALVIAPAPIVNKYESKSKFCPARFSFWTRAADCCSFSPDRDVRPGTYKRKIATQWFTLNWSSLNTTNISS